MVDVPGGQPRGGVSWISRKGEMAEERLGKTKRGDCSRDVIYEKRINKQSFHHMKDTISRVKLSDRRKYFLVVCQKRVGYHEHILKCL